MKGLIFTYLMTYGGSLVALFNPFVGLLIYICFAIIKPESLWYWAVPEGNYSRIIAVALLIGWAIQGFGHWQFGKGRGILLMFVGFWLWIIPSTMGSSQPELGWIFLESMAKVFLPFLVGMTLIDSDAKLKQLEWVMTLSLGYVAFEMNLSYYSGFNRMQIGGFGGMDNNSFAIEMVAGVGLALFLAFGAEKWWQKALALVAAILMAHSVIFSFSRGGMLALIVTAGVGFFLLPKKPKHYLVFALVILLGLRLAGQEVTERFMTTFAKEENRDASAQSRLDLWADCWDVMLHYPVFGVGPDHWPLIAAEYGWPEGKEAHTLWLQTGAELGFAGLAFLGLFYGLCIARLFPLARSKLGEQATWQQDLARMVIASLSGFVVAAQFVSLETLEFSYYVVLLGAGLLKQISSQQSQRKDVEAFGQPSNECTLPRSI
ncbi:MAG: O-antigen ligase family protein [Nitrospira sp.]|nr:O-antigen ligase family protein [Nitrospira sp.]MCA9498454.1 O-antigen ligase family protein [Nitrospira sp.]